MAPTKRAASKPAARPAKAAKTAQAAEEPRFTIVEELKEGGVPASCLDMLSAALPHALETPKEERHKFQMSVIESIGELSRKERTRREEELSKAEAALASHDQEKLVAEEKATAANAEELARREKKVEAEARVATVSAAADSAAKALKEAKDIASGAERAVEGASKEKDDFVSKVDELWPSLRDATFEKKDWRQRQKVITQVVNIMKPFAPESLAASLPLALKEGLDTRGPFAKMAVDETDRVLKDHAQSLDTAIATAKAAFEASGEVVASAEAMLKDASAARDQTVNDCIATENEWLEAKEESSAMAKFIRNADAVRSEKEAAVQEARESLEALDAAIKEFSALEEPPAPAEPAPVEPDVVMAEPLAVVS